MKKMIVLMLSVFLVISLIGNVVLYMKLSDKNSNNESENVYDSNNVPDELIGIELNRCAMACEGCGAVFSLT